MRVRNVTSSHPKQWHYHHPMPFILSLKKKKKKTNWLWETLSLEQHKRQITQEFRLLPNWFLAYLSNISLVGALPCKLIYSSESLKGEELSIRLQFLLSHFHNISGLWLFCHPISQTLSLSLSHTHTHTHRASCCISHLSESPKRYSKSHQ